MRQVEMRFKESAYRWKYKQWNSESMQLRGNGNTWKWKCMSMDGNNLEIQRDGIAKQCINKAKSNVPIYKSMYIYTKQ